MKYWDTKKRNYFIKIVHSIDMAEFIGSDMDRITQVDPPQLGVQWQCESVDTP